MLVRMSTSISSIDIERLCRLAQLALADSEREAAVADLQGIIAMVDRMREIDTDGVAPLAHPLDAVARLRADKVTETVDRELFQRGAPATSDGFYLVPRVIE
jgi:aspartyl-tRNA(Asn)/glutamyl-tRNA(Gln) amidotransferase subunit C